MTRPEVSVVMPFAGQAHEQMRARDSLRAIDRRPGDELILADNSGGSTPASSPAARPEAGAEVLTISATGERSPAHARNVGAAEASTEWILFLDSDCQPLPGLLEAYFRLPIGEDVGALVGEVVGSRDGLGLAERYGAARNFLSQRDHMNHPYLPRAAAANLLVRRTAFEAVGGFYEGVRAAEDTDFSWRLQQAGWRLEPRPEARVEHRYRSSVAGLRRQWRSYAAGRAWLARRYEGFEPEPAVARGLERAARRLARFSRGLGREQARSTAASAYSGRSWREQAPFLALDAVLALEELAGFALSNRPGRPEADGQAEVVLVADEFPRRADPLVELATTLGRARIEAVARPQVPDVDASRRLAIDYLEDEGAAATVLASLALAVAHPVRVVRDLAGRSPGGEGGPSTWKLAPAARRLEREPLARVQALGGPKAQSTARRLAALAARPLE